MKHDETLRSRVSYEVASAVTPVPKKVLVVALSIDGTMMRSSHVAECPDLGPACNGQNKPTPYEHRLVNYAYGATLDAQLGVTDGMAIAISIPFRAVTTRVRYTDLEGRSYTPNPADTHHANRTISGLGDPMVAALLGKSFGRVGFAIRIGALLPMGRTLNDDPFHLGHQGLEHEHVQFGAGMLRPVLGSALGLDLGRIGNVDFGFDAWTIGILSLQTNLAGYKAGQRLSTGFRLSSALGTRSARVGIGAELARETAETWHDELVDDGNQGRTDLLGLLTARWSPFARVGFFGVVRVPLMVRAVGAQLSYPAHVQLGVATALPL